MGSASQTSNFVQLLDFEFMCITRTTTTHTLRLNTHQDVLTLAAAQQADGAIDEVVQGRWLGRVPHSFVVQVQATRLGQPFRLRWNTQTRRGVSTELYARKPTRTCGTCKGTHLWKQLGQRQGQCPRRWRLRRRPESSL